MSSLLINATGLVALGFNVFGLIRTSDSSLRRSTGWASALWAVNNLLIGAYSAAALSVLSVGRQASASAVQARSDRIKLIGCLGFVVLSLVIGAATWNGMATVCTAAGSMLATYAMFYLRGAPLRIAMFLVAALWMYNAWAFNSWWQMLANLLSGAAAIYGAWLTSRTVELVSVGESSPAGLAICKGESGLVEQGRQA